MKSELLLEAEQMASELSEWRRTLHRIPETGTVLPKTVTFITEKLKEMGIAYQVYEECSCVAALVGSGEPCIMLRSDMDALPVQEESGEPFASTNGCMHACGHDLHMTALLGAARLLKAHEKEFKGTVKLFFQSGEEIFSGAKAAIEAGVLKDPAPEAAFAMHVSSFMDINTITYGAYPMSAVYGFRITLEGKGAHGSSPQLGIDPINAGVHIHLALQELMAREVAAGDETALTIGKFQAGMAANVIPQTAVLEGTLRAFDMEVRTRLIGRIHEVVEHVAAAYRTKASIEVLSDVPVLACDEAITGQYLDSVRSLSDEIRLIPGYHDMVSEDFAYFSERMPAGYFSIGAAVEEPSKRTALHNPKVLFREEALPLGAAVHARVAMDYLRKALQTTNKVCYDNP